MGPATGAVVKCQRCDVRAALKGRTRCEPCRVICADYAAQKRRAQLATGGCLEINCPYQAEPDDVYCAVHRAYRAAQRKTLKEKLARIKRKKK